MRALVLVVTCVLACGGPESGPPPLVVAHVVEPLRAAAPAAPACGAGVPAAACARAGIRACAAGDRDRLGAWRYALVGAPFEPTQDVSVAALRAAWRAGRIDATADTATALAPVLGARGAGHGDWAIVPAHELEPGHSVIAVDGVHPLAADDGVLAVPLCGAGAPVRNIDPAHVTTLVMSGTTALTGRTAQRIDERGIADTIRFIRPYFTTADLVHVSNEVAFVKGCDPKTGQDAHELRFCARDHYIELLAALHATIIELTGSHLVDYGHGALVRTIDMYERRGWIWFGGGRTQVEAATPRIVEDHGNNLGFVGCNAVNEWVHAISAGPGTSVCDWPRLAWQIHDLRRRGITPIASVQHRELRTHAPPPDLVEDLRRLAEAGAAFVEGSQAHVAHPWDVHHGAYVHYGPGNVLFAQGREVQRDATIDKLYIHEGRLLTVGHLYIRTEHGQPRLMTETERARFLAELAAAERDIAPPEPAVVPPLPPEERTRPDSFVIRGRSQRLTITAPARVAPGARYGLVVDAPAGAASDDAYVVRRRGRANATAAEIAAFVRARYPIDPARVALPR